MNYIQTRTDGNLYFITINRPRKRNAFTPEMIRNFAAAVQAADESPAVRAIIVSAEGPVFSAGIDVLGLMQARAEAGEQNPGRWLRRWVEELQYHLNRIESVELPVIGALRGQVIGFGLELALAFDLRVASTDCHLSIPEARLGLVADLGGSTRLSRVIGPARNLNGVGGKVLDVYALPAAKIAVISSHKLLVNTWPPSRIRITFSPRQQ